MNGPLSRLSHLIQAAQESGQYIRKSKIYLKIGQKPPNGVRVYDGKHGGRYYLTEDLGDRQKRLPAFRKQSDGSLSHQVKAGPHGEGHYRISHDAGTFHLHFHGTDGRTHHLGTSSQEPLQALKELKGMVQDHKSRSMSVHESDESYDTPGPEKKKKIVPAGARQKSKKTRYMPLNLQIRNIKRVLANRDMDVEAIDVYSLVDPTLSYEENERLVLSAVGEKSTREKKKEEKRNDENYDFCMHAQEQCEAGDREACLSYMSEGCHKNFGEVDVPLAVNQINGEDHTDVSDYIQNKKIPFYEAHRWFKSNHGVELVGRDVNGTDIDPGSSTVAASYHLKGNLSKEEVEAIADSQIDPNRYEETRGTAIQPFHMIKNPKWTVQSDNSLSIKRYSNIDASPFQSKPVRSVLDGEFRISPGENGSSLMYRKAGTQDWYAVSHSSGPNPLHNLRNLKADASHLSANPAELSMRRQDPRQFTSESEPVKVAAKQKPKAEKPPKVSPAARKRIEKWNDLTSPESASREWDFVADYLAYVTEDEKNRSEQADGRKVTKNKKGGYTLEYRNGAKMKFSSARMLYEYVRRTNRSLSRLCQEGISIRQDIRLRHIQNTIHQAAVSAS